jgi:hypothetical protein
MLSQIPISAKDIKQEQVQELEEGKKEINELLKK